MTGRRLAWIVSGFALLLGAGIALHLPGLNGPSYWQWTWRRLSWVSYPVLLVAVVPFAIAQYRYRRNRDRVHTPLLLIALSAFLLQMVAAGVQGDPWNLARIWQVHQACKGNTK